MNQFPENPTCQIKNLHLMYEELFGDIHGLFVDVGAFDAYSLSNTWTLAEAGWFGMLVEPISSAVTNIRLHYSDRPDIIVEQCCVGSYNGKIKLHTVQDHAVLATTNQKVVDEKIWGDTYTDAMECDVYTLDHLLQLHGIYTMIDVLSIDVEGAEMDVLNGFNISAWEPRMVIIETHDGHVIPARRVFAPAINEYMTSHGYELKSCDTLNSIFVPRHA